MLKSKFIASSKIKCEDGVVIFPHLENIASFLPWIYTDKSFTTGSHLLKVCSQRFPLVNNCGFLIL